MSTHGGPFMAHHLLLALGAFVLWFISFMGMMYLADCAVRSATTFKGSIVLFFFMLSLILVVVCGILTVYHLIEVIVPLF